MLLSRIELEILHIFWSSTVPLSVDEISTRLGFFLLKKETARIAIDSLLSKQYVSQTGLYQNYSKRPTNNIPLYTSVIRFVDYYSIHFEKITSNNLFDLCKWLLTTITFTEEMQQELSHILSDNGSAVNCCPSSFKEVNADRSENLVE